MRTSVATIRAARDFALPVEDIFAHWTSPVTRRRWEAGPDTGMVYDGFDTRPGGTETVRVMQDGREIGRMIQTHLRVDENRLLASSMVGIFGGVVTMMTALVVEFIATEDGSRIEAVAQASDLSGRDIARAQEAGWSWILERFQADIDAYGPITNPKP
ncbi:SRPBCC domain-containing protein [Roseibacterium sp. SDUM158017]|uniref:SRPBCC domain-containing protein n=1 Tax=Roseicyclus salinarum TaxID=3036773 RepID=UPI002414E02C|nr:SRPBCC domain-containing protein [Roseibacterium sp. SDUM158017]MDG4649665.1 SRPBCC domain-containing protein [Roseibacterium sp. SDUM158017]